MRQFILVWDLPTRVFHWSLATTFLIAYLTGESERWAMLHMIAGLSLAGLIGFRVIWGIVGTRYARFSSFLPSLRTVTDYVNSLIVGNPAVYIGHNPLGSLAIYALLALGLLATLSGWLLYIDRGGDWLEGTHEIITNLMLVIVLLHITGVAISCRIHRQNLVLAMFTGKKQGQPDQGISGNRPVVAWLLVACLATFWVLSYSETGRSFYAGTGRLDLHAPMPEDEN